MNRAVVQLQCRTKKLSYTKYLYFTENTLDRIECTLGKSIVVTMTNENINVRSDDVTPVNDFTFQQMLAFLKTIYLENVLFTNGKLYSERIQLDTNTIWRFNQWKNDSFVIEDIKTNDDEMITQSMIVYRYLKCTPPTYDHVALSFVNTVYPYVRKWLYFTKSTLIDSSVDYIYMCLKKVRYELQTLRLELIHHDDDETASRASGSPARTYSAYNPKYNLAKFWVTHKPSSFYALIRNPLTKYQEFVSHCLLDYKYGHDHDNKRNQSWFTALYVQSDAELGVPNSAYAMTRDPNNFFKETLPTKKFSWSIEPESVFYMEEEEDTIRE